MSFSTSTTHIFTAADAEAGSEFSPDLRVSHIVLATGEHEQLVWAKFEPDGTYPLHSHPYEQTSEIDRLTLWTVFRPQCNPGTEKNQR